MNRRMHASLARQLVAACGGLEEAADFCRVGKTQLGDYQSPHGESFMPADVIADLEAHCGRPAYSAALAEAQPAKASEGDLKDAACDAVEAAAALLTEIRKALAGGQLTPAERDHIGERRERAAEDLREIGEILARGD